MILTAKKKRLVLTTTVVLPLLIFFALALVFPIANLFSAVASLALEREPTRSELIGTYKYNASWGTATLTLNDAGTFKELVVNNAGYQKQFDGLWTSGNEENSAKVNFRPFGMVWDNDHDREINLFAMNFYKRRQGKTYAKVDDDLGEQFERQ